MSDITQWNINAKKLTYNKIDVSPILDTTINEKYTISSNDFYIVNPTTSKKITLKYSGNVDYNFELPATSPPLNGSSLLVADQNSLTWQLATNYLDKRNLYVVNSANDKRITLKYSGINDYDLVLPRKSPAI